jgi:hypothetical protein
VLYQSEEVAQQQREQQERQRRSQRKRARSDSPAEDNGSETEEGPTPRQAGKRPLLALRAPPTLPAELDREGESGEGGTPTPPVDKERGGHLREVLPEPAGRLEGQNRSLREGEPNEGGTPQPALSLCLTEAESGPAEHPERGWGVTGDPSQSSAQKRAERAGDEDEEREEGPDDEPDTAQEPAYPSETERSRGTSWAARSQSSPASTRRGAHEGDLPRPQTSVGPLRASPVATDRVTEYQRHDTPKNLPR